MILKKYYIVAIDMPLVKCWLLII